VPQPGNPQALNRYAYVLNNPLRYTDPTGHFIFEEQDDPYAELKLIAAIEKESGIPVAGFQEWSISELNTVREVLADFPMDKIPLGGVARITHSRGIDTTGAAGGYDPATKILTIATPLPGLYEDIASASFVQLEGKAFKSAQKHNF